MVKFAVMIFESPYGREKSYTALRFALTALNDGHEVTVILIQDGVFNGLKKQEPAEYPNIQEYLEMAIDEGLNIIVCGVCCQARGIKQEDLLNNIKIVGMHEIVEACANADKVINF